jgi:putative ABC transport system permease protein
MYVRLLFWSLRHRRWRHLLNAIAIAVTAAVVVVFVATISGLVAFTHSISETTLTRILLTPRLVTPGSTTDGMPMTFRPMLEKIDGVRVVQRKLVVGGRDPSGATYLVIGEEDSGIELNTDIYPVDKATFEAWKKERTGAIVTEATARALRLEVGETAEVTIPAGKVQIKVVGIARGAVFTHTIGVHFDYLQELTKITQTCGYRVFTGPADADRVIREIGKLTRNSAMPARGVIGSRYRASLAKQASTIPTVLGFLGIFLMLTTALTLANNCAISIRERRVEVATLRVIGYYPRTIARQLVGEAVLVGLIGGVVGIAIVWFAFRGGVQLTPSGMPPTTIGWFAMACALAVAVAVPLIGSIPSALSAVRTPLVDGLRDTA